MPPQYFSRQLSLSLGNNDSYIGQILGGKGSMSFEGLSLVLDHFRMSFKDFFNDDISLSPYYIKELYNESVRITGGDLAILHRLFQPMTPEDYQSLLKFLRRQKHYDI